MKKLNWKTLSLFKSFKKLSVCPPWYSYFWLFLMEYSQKQHRKRLKFILLVFSITKKNLAAICFLSQLFNLISTIVSFSSRRWKPFLVPSSLEIVFTTFHGNVLQYPGFLKISLIMKFHKKSSRMLFAK